MIKTDFILKPNDKEFKKMAGKRADRIFKSQRNIDAYEKAKSYLINLSKPAVAWNKFLISEFKHDKILLENGIEIGGGPVVKVIGGAQELVVAVCTIGKDIQCKVKEVMKEGNIFQSVMLDGMASWAVDSVRRQFVDWIYKDLKKKKLKKSIHLSPGESTWTVKQQSVIFKLLEEETKEIGVNLKESMMMIPLKSISIIFGVGPNKMGNETGSNCDYCTMKEKCRYRHLRSNECNEE